MGKVDQVGGQLVQSSNTEVVLRIRRKARMVGSCKRVTEDGAERERAEYFLEF